MFDLHRERGGGGGGTGGDEMGWLVLWSVRLVSNWIDTAMKSR